MLNWKSCPYFSQRLFLHIPSSPLNNSISQPQRQNTFKFAEYWRISKLLNVVRERGSDISFFFHSLCKLSAVVLSDFFLLDKREEDVFEVLVFALDFLRFDVSDGKDV